ncbi:MAG: hypothetical protein LBV51_03495 [Acholeplasmatales bacterium]|jgi:hypothetical protein|nr:hypothetical protein [Acholeplasmatales bacterium]
MVSKFNIHFDKKLGISAYYVKKTQKRQSEIVIGLNMQYKITNVYEKSGIIIIDIDLLGYQK